MNRDIRFSGLRVDGMGWAYGYLFTDCNGVKYILPCGQTLWRTESDDFSMRSVSDSHHVKPETVGQFINRNDSEGAEIFCGDIIDIGQTVNGQSKFIVFYDEEEMKVGLKYLDGWNYEYSVCEIFEPCRFSGETDIKVVGNIHTK